MVDSVYFVKSTPLRAVIGSFQHFVGMKICMKKFDAVHIFF